MFCHNVNKKIRIMANLKNLKLSKSQMNSISGGMLCKVKYTDGSWNYKVVNSTLSAGETAAELTIQGMGAYVVTC